MKKTLINEVRQLQKIAGILKENEDNVIPGGPDWVSLSVFLEALGLNPKDPIFQGAMKNRDIEELLQMIEDTAGLDQYTKSDLIDAMEEAQFSQDMIDFIIDENPLVKGLERGLKENQNLEEDVNYSTPNLDVSNLFDDSENHIESAVGDFVEKYLDTAAERGKYVEIKDAESLEQVEEILGKELPTVFTLVLQGDYSDNDTIHDLGDGYYVYVEGYDGGIVGILSKAGLSKLVQDLKAMGAKPYAG